MKKRYLAILIPTVLAFGACSDIGETEELPIETGTIPTVSVDTVPSTAPPTTPPTTAPSTTVPTTVPAPVVFTFTGTQGETLKQRLPAGDYQVDVAFSDCSYPTVYLEGTMLWEYFDAAGTTYLNNVKAGEYFASVGSECPYTLTLTKL